MAPPRWPRPSGLTPENARSEWPHPCSQRPRSPPWGWSSEASATATTGDVVPIDVGSAHYLVELDPASLGIATNATLTVRAGLVPPASAVPAGSDDNVRVEPADASGTIVVWRRSPSDPQMWIALEGKGIEVDQLLAFARRILVRAPAPVGSTVTCPPDGCG